jgi:hypothetical protein
MDYQIFQHQIQLPAPHNWVTLTIVLCIAGLFKGVLVVPHQVHTILCGHSTTSRVSKATFNKILASRTGHREICKNPALLATLKHPKHQALHKNCGSVTLCSVSVLARTLEHLGFGDALFQAFHALKHVTMATASMAGEFEPVF